MILGWVSLALGVFLLYLLFTGRLGRFLSSLQATGGGGSP